MLFSTNLDLFGSQHAEEKEAEEEDAGSTYPFLSIIDNFLSSVVDADAAVADDDGTSI